MIKREVKKNRDVGTKRNQEICPYARNIHQEIHSIMHKQHFQKYIVIVSNILPKN